MSLIFEFWVNLVACVIMYENLTFSDYTQVALNETSLSLLCTGILYMCVYVWHCVHWFVYMCVNMVYHLTAIS